MKKFWFTVLAALAVLAFVGTADAGGDAAAGAKKAKSCAGCHGKKGEGKKKNPPLAGMEEAKFVKAMQDYKSGAKKNKMMKKFAKKLSDGDMANLAAYYHSLK
jgi:cytochrome c553